MLALTSDIRTPLHDLPANLKIAVMSIGVFSLFLVDSTLFQILAAAGVAAVYRYFGAAFFWQGLRMLRPLRLFLFVLGLVQFLSGDIEGGIVVICRLTTAVALANLVTLTTRLDDMISFVLRISRPFAFVGLSPKAFALSIALVIRFIPVLLDRANMMQDAFRARSTRKPTFYIVLPLVLSVLDDAEHVAAALRARGGLDGQFEP